MLGRLVANLKEYGAFVKPVEKRRRQPKEENENTVLEAVVEDPNISTRQIENETEIPKFLDKEITKNYYCNIPLKIFQNTN